MNKREEERLRRQKEKLEKEIVRTEAMSVFEKEYSDHQAICGIDEVGRGPLQVRLLPELSYYQRIIRFCILMIRRNYQKRSGKSCMK